MWDYLIITASNDAQADGYKRQLDTRLSLGLLCEVKEVLVVADPGGKRIGSGGSTLHCILEIVKRGLAASPQADPAQILSSLRVLIVHAGGDSKRLPAYGPCGKLFIPVPGNNDTPLALTLFDRQLPVYLKLPMPQNQRGQIVVTAGDVLLRFDPSEVVFSPEGITGLAAGASPAEASKHGVFMRGSDKQVRRFLQKPSVELQKNMGLLDAFGNSTLDIGIMNFDAATAVKMLEMAGFERNGAKCGFKGDVNEAVFNCGLDFYQEICCAMGSDTSQALYNQALNQSGSKWPLELRGRIYNALKDVKFSVDVLPFCEFLHFGTSAQITRSGLALLRNDAGVSVLDTCLTINNKIRSGGFIEGKNSWAESCVVDAGLTLCGNNVVSGVDVKKPLVLPEGMCVDCTAGIDGQGRAVTFLRIYGINDGFKEKACEGAAFCNVPIMGWLQSLGIGAEEIWPDYDGCGDITKTLWTAKLFPALSGDFDINRWFWMYDTAKAAKEDIDNWRALERYSLEQIAELTDQQAFFVRRNSIRSTIIGDSLVSIFAKESRFSAKELAMVLKYSENTAALASKLIEFMYNLRQLRGSKGGLWYIMPRIAHSLGTALEILYGKDKPLYEVLPDLGRIMACEVRRWLEEFTCSPWPTTAMLRGAAFGYMSKVIIDGNIEKAAVPCNMLRPDEIVWGRAPARMDVGGGWSDTPPYSLVYGGSVMNVAIDMNGQPPIHVYARVVPQPVITICSIDLGVRIEIKSLDELLDYGKPGSEFGLAKAAIALSGFSPMYAKWPEDITLEKMMSRFGGGLEITTLAAIPKGSGLGTSSIVGATLVAVINRVFGRTLDHRQLFYEVLKLEQALTTGGGWQDQLGGVLGGSKLAISEAGIVPAPAVNYVPCDVVDPQRNGSKTLLYYTGITRLAKNILEQVVSKQFNCDRDGMNTIRMIHNHAEKMADAFMKKDYAAFARCVSECWRQNNALDPDSTNPEVERIIEMVRPFAGGLKLLGAGGGGFMLICANSAQDADKIRLVLNDNPPNNKARFFDYSINNAGLTVSVC